VSLAVGFLSSLIVVVALAQRGLGIAVLTALVVLGAMILDEVPILDPATPSAGLDLLHLDECFEAVQIAPSRTLDVPQAAGGLLD
jgi:hypothetical protein